MRDKDTFALREMFQYFSLAEKPFDHWEIITLWRAFQIIDKSRHGLVKMTYSEDNWWCSWVEQRGDLKGQNVYMWRGELSVKGSINSIELWVSSLFVAWISFQFLFVCCFFSFVQVIFTSSAFWPCEQVTTGINVSHSFLRSCTQLDSLTWTCIGHIHIFHHLDKKYRTEHC